MSGFPNSMRLKGLLWEIGSLVGWGTHWPVFLISSLRKAIILNLAASLLSSLSHCLAVPGDAARHSERRRLVSYSTGPRNKRWDEWKTL